VRRLAKLPARGPRPRCNALQQHLRAEQAAVVAREQ
jgi:hypothetical protein